MVALQGSFPAGIFTCILLSSNVLVHGFSESSCPKDAVVEMFLTRNISGEFTKNLTWSRDNGRLGCMCDIRKCVSLCCASGMGQVDGWRCVDDNVTTFETLPTIGNLTYKDFHPIVDNPCRFHWMAPSVITDFKFHPNGTIHAPHYDGGSPSNLEQYCLFREPGSAKFSAKVCRAWVRKNCWDIVILFVAILVMIIIFIGFTITPELRNLHGLIFRCYVGTYIGLYVCALVAEFVTENRTLPLSFFSCFEVTIRYFGGCCIFWLNVMSFNIWRTFRWLRPVDRHVRRFERDLFNWYAIYAWLTPIAIGIVPLVAIYTVPQFRDDVLRHDFKNWGSAVVIAAVLVCNSVFYISTALRLREHKNNTSHMTHRVNGHHEVDRRWFSLHLKLFLIMGAHLIMWSIFLVWPSPEITHVFAALEVFQNMLIFYIFLWNDDFKRAVSRRFDYTLSAPGPIAHFYKDIENSGSAEN